MKLQFKKQQKKWIFTRTLSIFESEYNTKLGKSVDTNKYTFLCMKFELENAEHNTLMETFKNDRLICIIVMIMISSSTTITNG